MIIVTIELHGAVSLTRKVLGTLKIANDGTGTAATGNYTAELRGANGRVLETCRVRGFPRKRRLACDLVYRALRAMRGDQNGDDVTDAQRRALDAAGGWVVPIEMLDVDDPAAVAGGLARLANARPGRWATRSTSQTKPARL